MFLLDLLTAIFIVLTCWGTGRFVLKYTKLSSSDTVIDAVISAGIGFTLLVYIQMICGFTGLLSSFQGWTIQLAMTVMTIIGFILWNPKFPAIKIPHFKKIMSVNSHMSKTCNGWHISPQIYCFHSFHIILFYRSSIEILKCTNSRFSDLSHIHS